jgi:hypothetical protein
MKRTKLHVAALVLGAGCGSNHMIGDGQQRPTSAMTSPILIGGTPGAGLPDYTAVANTGSYRITWLGDGTSIFNGSVYAETNALLQLYPGCTDMSCALVAGQDVVQVNSSDANRVDFFSQPAAGQDSGFDLTLVAGEPQDLIIDLLVNSVAQPAEVHYETVVSGSGMPTTAPKLPLDLVPTS